MQNGRQKDVLFVDGSKIGRITKLSSVISVSIIVGDLCPLVVELFLIIYIFFQIYELLKVVMSTICFLVYYEYVK